MFAYIWGKGFVVTHHSCLFLRRNKYKVLFLGAARGALHTYKISICQTAALSDILISKQLPQIIRK